MGQPQLEKAPYRYKCFVPVIHSTTKYLGGHSDLAGGTVIGRRELIEPIWVWRKNLEEA